MTIYHVLNRGVDKRKIFLDEEDYFRFIHDLFEFNDADLVNNALYRFHRQSKVVGRPYIKKKRKMLVDILVFCLMPNHYHLLLASRGDNGIPRFMHKMNGVYARYFNEKYKRRGALFEGGYKSVAVKTDAHFIHLPYYIHLNPLDLIAPEWRNRELRDYKEALKFLGSYRWSSHLDYAGIKNFPSVTQREFLTKFFSNSSEYKKSIKKWLKTLNLEDLGSLKLE